MLRRGGAFETLTLPRDATAIGGAMQSPAAINGAELRGAQQNPGRLLDWFRPVAATESDTGRQLGYRIYPGRDPDRFSALGLLPGDLITAVNGQSLDDPARSMELLRGLGPGDAVVLTLERDGTQRILQLPVTQ